MGIFTTSPINRAHTLKSPQTLLQQNHCTFMHPATLLHLRKRHLPRAAVTYLQLSARYSAEGVTWTPGVQATNAISRPKRILS